VVKIDLIELTTAIDNAIPQSELMSKYYWIKKNFYNDAYNSTIMKRIVSSFTECDLKYKDQVFKQNERAYKFYIIVDGEIVTSQEVDRRAGNQESDEPRRHQNDVLSFFKEKKKQQNSTTIETKCISGAILGFCSITLSGPPGNYFYNAAVSSNIAKLYTISLDVRIRLIRASGR